jgi:hypothetical protein
MERPVSAWWLDSREGGKEAAPAMMRNQIRNVDICEAISIGKTERLIIQIILHSQQSTTGLTRLPGIHKGHLPALTLSLVNLHPIAFVHVKGYVTSMQKIIGKIFFYQVALVPTAYNKLIYAVGSIQL